MGTGKVVAGILTVLGLAATSAPIAMAQESQEAGENNVPPTMLILDASGSMGETDAGGQTRMDTAKEATHTFLDGVPEDSELGFITYGTGTSNAPEEREAGCEDVTTLAPLAAGSWMISAGKSMALRPPATPRWDQPCARLLMNFLKKARATWCWCQTALIPARHHRSVMWRKNYMIKALT